MGLRPYQEQVVGDVRAAYGEGHRRICVCMATGMGKTETCREFVQRGLQNGLSAIWCTHRTALVEQASRRFTAAQMHHGVIQSGAAPTPGRFQIASIQTLAARPHEMPEADLLVFDEAHHHTSKSWQSVSNRYPKAIIIGPTATPERADGSPLGDVYTHMVQGPSMAWAIQHGYLSEYDVIGPKKPQKGLCMTIAEALKLCGERKTILFAASTAEAEAIAKEHGGACITAETHALVRQEILAQFASGTIGLITNCNVLSEGFDCPDVEAVIIARGCSSIGMWLQMCGRGLRPSPNRALIIDLRGSVHIHGMPDEDREFGLTGKGISASLASLKQCAECGAVFDPRPKCPRCGAVPPAPKPQKVKRTPASIIASDSVATKREKYAKFQELCDEQRAKGYKSKWVGVQFMREYGHWPPFRVPKQGVAA